MISYQELKNFINNEVFSIGEHINGHWKFPFTITSNDTVVDLLIGRKYTSKYYHNYI